MRTIPQSPVIRVVRSQRPYTSARQLWKERMARRQAEPRVIAAVERQRSPVLETHREDDDCVLVVDEREPCVNECAPLRSDECRGDSSSIEDDEYKLHRHEIPDGRNESSFSYSHCATVSDDSDQEEGEGCRVSLDSLPRATASSAWNQISGQASGDVHTINEHFQTMTMARQQERRRAQRAIKQEKSAATRRRVLMNILGMNKFYKTLSLVREIKGIHEKIMLRCSKVAGVTCAMKVIVCRVKFDSLPKSARDLMARTHLLSAVERTAVERLSKLPWDELIAEAQANLHAYREWMSVSETRE